MTKFRLNRRTLLRGAGSLAIGLPWLEAMDPVQTAHAQPTAAQRFVAVYQPGGTVRDRWRPTGSETGYTTSSILEPMDELRAKYLVLSNLDMVSAIGEQHQAGIVALLTGTPQSPQRGQYAGGPSIDQVIAGIASAGKPRASIEMAVRWATGKSHGLLHPINSMTFADNDNFTPLPPRIDPVEIWESLFGTLEPGEPGMGTDMVLQRRMSILDFLDRRYESLSLRLSGNDRARIEEHLQMIREHEMGLASIVDLPTDTGCAAPTQVDTSDYNPSAGLSADDNGDVVDGSSDAAIPKVGRYMMDMLVMALRCDLTAVATLQWSDTEAKHTFPWLNLSEHHHFYQHDGGFQADQCEQIGRWYSEQHFYLLQQMDAVDMGGHTLLDESVVFFGSELQEPPLHQKNDMPFLLAGGGGGLQGGRWLQFNGRSHNDLLVSILNLFGDTRTSFGDGNYCDGALPGLTA
jgi:hypothetical protein